MQRVFGNFIAKIIALIFSFGVVATSLHFHEFLPESETSVTSGHLYADCGLCAVHHSLDTVALPAPCSIGDPVFVLLATPESHQSAPFKLRNYSPYARAPPALSRI